MKNTLLFNYSTNILLKIVELVKAGKKFYTVNDNFNCKTTVKNMRVDHRNKQHNWPFLFKNC